MSEKLYKTSEIINPNMGFNMSMNKYVTKDGREAVMHDNRTHVTTTDGTEWTLCSSIVTVGGKAIPSSAVIETAKTVVEIPAKPSTPPPDAAKK